MDSELKNEFPVGQCGRPVGKNAEKFIFKEFFAFIIFLFGRLTEFCKKKFNSDLSYISFSSLGHI